MEIFAALTACWPASEIRRLGPWTLRRGEGGKRTRAATLDGMLEGPLGDPAEAEAAMRAAGQAPLFMVRDGEDALDDLLAARGYGVPDRVAILGAPAGDLAGERPDWAVVRCAAPLAALVELWAATGVGPGRLAVMDQVALPKVWLLARDGDRPAGCAFVDFWGEIAMLQAVAVAPASRRRGLGARLVRSAAGWAAEHGAARLALAVSRDNEPALALYRSLGLSGIARYHYRAAPA